MHNDGKKYERFVAGLQQAIINSETITAQKNINIELNKKIIDNCGVEREFDLYWEYELGGITYKTIIECKDYNSDMSVENISLPLVISMQFCQYQCHKKFLNRYM